MINVTFSDYSTNTQVLSINSSAGMYVQSYNIAPPEVDERYVDIPGASGFVDLTEAIAGYPLYKTRKVKINVVINPNVVVGGFSAKMDTIKSAIHGKHLKVRFSDDASYYFDARVIVSSMSQANKDWRFSIECTCQPYKLLNSKGITTFTISGTTEASQSILYSMPTWVDVNNTTSETISIKIGSDSYVDVTKGNHKEFYLGYGTMTIKVKGKSGSASGTVEITSQGGKL